MKKALVLTASAAVGALLPAIAFAAQINNLSDIGTFIVNTINGLIVPVLFAVAFIVFLYGAFQAFIIGHNDEDSHKKGKNLMLWGLIGFFVMVSVWGLVNILTGTVSFSNNSGPSTGFPTAGVRVP